MDRSHGSDPLDFLGDLEKRSVEFQTQVLEVLQLLEDYNKVKLLGEGKDIGGVVEIVNFLNENNYIQILSLETVLTEGSVGKNKGMIQIWAEITKRTTQVQGTEKLRDLNVIKEKSMEKKHEGMGGQIAERGREESPETSEEEDEQLPPSSREDS